MTCSNLFSPANSSNNNPANFLFDEDSSWSSLLLSNLQSEGSSGSRSTLASVVVPRAAGLRNRPLLLGARATGRNSATTASKFRNAGGTSSCGAGPLLCHTATNTNNNHDGTLLTVLQIIDQAIFVMEQDDDLRLADAEEYSGGIKNPFDHAGQ